MITTITLNASIDKAYSMDREIENGTVMRVASIHNSAGGKGLNVARVIRLCKEDVLASGLVGGYNGRLCSTRTESAMILTILKEKPEAALIFWIKPLARRNIWNRDVR